MFGFVKLLGLLKLLNKLLQLLEPQSPIILLKPTIRLSSLTILSVSSIMFEVIFPTFLYWFIDKFFISTNVFFKLTTPHSLAHNNFTSNALGDFLNFNKYSRQSFLDSRFFLYSYSTCSYFYSICFSFS